MVSVAIALSFLFGFGIGFWLSRPVFKVIDTLRIRRAMGNPELIKQFQEEFKAAQAENA